MLLLWLSVLVVQLIASLLPVDSTPTGPGVCFGTGYPTDLSLFASQHGASADTFNQAVTISIGSGNSTQLQVGCSYQVSVCTHNQQYTGFIAYWRKQSDHSHSSGLKLHGSSEGKGQQFSCDNDDGSATVAHNEPSWKGPNLEMLYTPPSDADTSVPVVFDVILVTGSDQNNAASDPWVLTSSTKPYTLVAGSAECPTVTSNTLCESSSSASVVPVATVDPMAGMDMGDSSMDMGSSSATTAASSSSSANSDVASTAAATSSATTMADGMSMPMSSSSTSLTTNNTSVMIMPASTMQRSDTISIAALCISVFTLLVVLYICINAPLRHYTLKDIIRHSFPAHHAGSNRSLSTAYQPLTTPAASGTRAAETDLESDQLGDEHSKGSSDSTYTEHATIATLPSQDAPRTQSIYSD